jgi:uncharacterized protein (DUF433 family)
MISRQVRHWSQEDPMAGEYIEQRNGGYYIAGTRILLDSVVYSFDRGISPEAIRKEYPVLRLAQIYGAVAGRSD